MSYKYFKKFNKSNESIRYFSIQENNYNLLTIILFFIFLFFIPLLWTTLTSIIWPDYNKTISWLLLQLNNSVSNEYILEIKQKYSSILDYYSISTTFISIVFPFISILILFIKDRKYFMRNSLWMLFVFFVLDPIILSTLSAFINSNNVLERNIIKLFSEFIIPLFFVLLYIFKNISTRNKIFIFKNIKNILKITFNILIFILFFYAFNILFSYIVNSYSNSNSFNQEILISETNSIFGNINLFLSAVLISPFFEEICFRKILFDVVSESKLKNRNKFLIFVYVISFLYFAYIHIYQVCDWSNFILYLPLGLTNGLLYWYFKNEYYCIISHFIPNFISYILITIL